MSAAIWDERCAQPRTSTCTLPPLPCSCSYNELGTVGAEELVKCDWPKLRVLHIGCVGPHCSGVFSAPLCACRVPCSIKRSGAACRGNTIEDMEGASKLLLRRWPGIAIKTG